MNVAILDVKGILKYIIRIIIIISLIIILISLYSKIKNNIKISDDLLLSFIETTTSLFSYKNNTVKLEEYDIKNILALELSVLNSSQINEVEESTEVEITEVLENNEEAQEKPEEIKIELPKVAQTESVSERNIAETSTNLYSTVKVKNNSDYELTEEMMIPDVELNNKKDILIFHTHTCESYTPCEIYNYEMTGNYRTTDNNYNMVRVGNELQTCLEEKGFNVTHDITYHDYPAYSGSYNRSLETVQNLLYDKTTEIVIDLHRDAVGNGDTYGPTVKIDGQRVAQMMFVIGTDGGGLEHPNWQQNVKNAIKIQETANKIYPGLFRPMIIRNSRYNQHVAPGACIIEVGATANTLEECLLSVGYLANILKESFLSF